MRFWFVPHMHKNLLKSPMQMYPAELEVLIGPRHEKTCLRGFRLSEIHTSVLSYRH